jgi:glycogen debranching enzyme
LIIHGAEYEITTRLPDVVGVSSYQLLWDSSDETPKAQMELSPGAELKMTPLSMVLIKAS